MHLNLEVDQCKPGISSLEMHVEDIRLGFRNGDRDPTQYTAFVERADIDSDGEMLAGSLAHCS